MTTIPAAQYLSARALASALGHRWAIVDLDDISFPTTPAAISAAVEAADPDETRGIAAPRLDGVDVVHVSRHGSIRYRVRPDGSVLLVLSSCASGEHIAGVYAALMLEVMYLVRRGVAVEVSSTRQPDLLDMDWGVPRDERIARAARACSERGVPEAEALAYLAAEVSGVSGRPSAQDIATFLEVFHRPSMFVAPPPPPPVQVETVPRRTQLAAVTAVGAA